MADLPYETVDSERFRREPPDARVARVADLQHGVASYAQLRRCGLSEGQIRHRRRNGRLHLLHRGVYAVGHAEVPWHGRFMAAVLAVGEGAVLSHRSAAVLWGLLRYESWPVDVTAARGLRSRRGMKVHEGDVKPAWRDGIPVTPVARTLLDCATVLDDRLLRRTVRQAEYDRRITTASLHEEIKRAKGHHGAKRLSSLIAPGPAPTRSHLEDELLDLIQEEGLPRPEVNVHVEGIEVDFLFRDQGVVVEADGRRAHEGEQARRRDAEREAVLEAAGLRVVRVTTAQVRGERAQTGRRLRRALTLPARPGTRW